MGSGIPFRVDLRPAGVHSSKYRSAAATRLNLRLLDELVERYDMTDVADVPALLETGDTP